MSQETRLSPSRVYLIAFIGALLAATVAIYALSALDAPPWLFGGAAGGIFAAAFSWAKRSNDGRTS